MPHGLALASMGVPKGLKGWPTFWKQTDTP